MENSSDKSAPLIYILESDPTFASELREVLQLNGFCAEVFTEPPKSEVIFGATKPDAVVLAGEHIEWFGNNQSVNLLKNETSIPVVAVSQQADITTRLAAVNAGSLDFFSKPANTHSILERLIEITNQDDQLPFRILIIDDDIDLAGMYCAILEGEGMSTTILGNPLSIFDVLRDFRPDLILMDLYMRECTGAQMAAIIRQDPQHVSIPIVFLSNEKDTAKQQSALRQGGDDFIKKPIDPENLVESVKNKITRFRELIKFIERDSLTGLLNHAKVIERLAIEISRSGRKDQSLSIGMLDIDFFKKVNDTYGHTAGDKVLESIAFFLKERLRRSDIIGRYGGEEFLVVLPDTDIKSAEKLFNKLREDFGKIKHSGGDAHFHCTFSCGVADYPASDSVHKLLQIADDRLYKAKDQGRNQVVAE